MRVTAGGVQAVCSLACFDSEFRAPVGAAFFMSGSPAIVGGTCGKGLVTLFSPHLEDGADEATRAPFRNAIRLCSSFCQHVRTSGAGPEQVRQLLEGICAGEAPSAQGEAAAPPHAPPCAPSSLPPFAPPSPTPSDGHQNMRLVSE